MSAHKHTPGPIGFHKCRCGYAGCDQYILSTQRSAGFDEADARLYAAAPDLLAAAAEMITHVNASHVPAEVIDDMRAAIAKATGAA